MQTAAKPYAQLIALLHWELIFAGYRKASGCEDTEANRHEMVRRMLAATGAR